MEIGPKNGDQTKLYLFNDGEREIGPRNGDTTKF
jgi:hypothetical protein